MEQKAKKKISMTTLIMAGTFLGLVVGAVLGEKAIPIGVFGDLFLRLIQMSVVVLIMGAVIEAVGQLNPKELGKIGWKVAVLFLTSTLIAATVGIVLGLIIKPGVGIDVKDTAKTSKVEAFVKEAFEDNGIDSALVPSVSVAIDYNESNSKTISMASVIENNVGDITTEEATIIASQIESLRNESTKKSDQSLPKMIVNFVSTNVVKSMAEGNMIQVIVFALLFGFSLARTGMMNNDNGFLKWIQDFNVVILGVVKTVMGMAPLGIFALMAKTTGEVGLVVIVPLLKFLVALAIGAIIIMIAYIIVTALYVGVSPLSLAKKLSRMTIVAFTTTSSAVTLPIKMEDQEKKLGVSKRISGLVGPLGMALNSNGLSLYLALACVTLSQFYGIDQTLGSLVQAVVLSTLACLGTVVVPGGGLVALTTVVPALGLPASGVGLLAGIDWFSGMFRTVLNVDVDALIALMIAKNEGEFSKEIYTNELPVD